MFSLSDQKHLFPLFLSLLWWFTLINKDVVELFKQIRTQQLSKVDKNRDKRELDFIKESKCSTDYCLQWTSLRALESRVIIFLKFIKLVSRTFETNFVWPLSVFWLFLRFGLHLRTHVAIKQINYVEHFFWKILKTLKK